MEYQTFRDRLLENMQKRIGARGEVSILTIQKNNSSDSERLLVRMHDKDAAPAIRIASCYEAYVKGVSMEDTLNHLLEVVEQELPDCLKKLDLEDYDLARNRLRMRLINTCKNAGMLLEHPHREFKDLSVVYRIDLDAQESGAFSAAVTHALLKVWDRTEDELFRQAWENMSRESDYKLMPIEQMLYALVGQENFADAWVEEEKTGLYVLTNRENSFGAIQLLNDRALKEAAQLLGGDYWIFPSSVHELILAPVEIGRNRSELEEMVRDINRTQVEPDEVLSDSVYYYDAGSGILC